MNSTYGRCADGLDQILRGLRPQARRAALHRKAAERTVDGLWTAIGRSVDVFTRNEIANYFAAAEVVPIPRTVWRLHYA